MACYAPDVEVFHPVSGLEQGGVEALRKAEELWFSTLAGPVDREVLDFRVRVDESIAFSHAPAPAPRCPAASRWTPPPG
jgi:ketosteroid isomerase-like protein